MRNEARVGRTLFALLIGGLLCGQAWAQDGEVGTPRDHAGDASSPLQQTITLSSGPDVGVLAYCTDLAGIFGAQNTVNTLLADGRFGSVTLIDGDVVLPTAQDLSADFDCVIAMTDNRCGLPIPQAIADAAANAMTGFALAGGGVVLSTFGFSHRPSGGIGFGASIFAPGLSPVQQATPFFNAPAGGVSLPGVGAGIPVCDRMLAGVSSVSSSFANYVGLSGGATLCANYLNGRNFLAINAAGNVAGLNTFPASQSDNNQADYRLLVGNVVNEVCGLTVAIDIKPQSCPNPLNVKSKGVLPVAILGSATFDVTEIDVSTVALEGVAPLRSGLEDVATPFAGDIQEALDCTEEGADGFLDLTLKFQTQAVVAALGPVSDGDVLLLTLTGNLLPAFGGTAFQGQDVVVIRAKP